MSLILCKTNKLSYIGGVEMGRTHVTSVINDDEFCINKTNITIYIRTKTYMY